MGVRNVALLRQFGAAIGVALLLIGCAGSDVDVPIASPLAGRWTQVQSGERISTVFAPNHDVHHGLAGVSGHRGRAELVIAADGRSVTYIPQRGRETAYQLGEGTLCYVDTAEPFCFEWKIVGERLLLCDLPPPDGCRVFERLP